MPDLRDRLGRADDLAAPDLWPEIRRRAARPSAAPPPWPETSRLGGRLVAGVVAFAIFAGGAVLAVRALLPDQTQPRSARDPWDSLAVGWTRLPDPPFDRNGVAATWTGGELVVWGGTTDYDTRFFADGAAFDPRTRTWRPIAASPLSPRSDAAAHWTGSEALFVGGYTSRGHVGDGAAYSPETDSWSMMPQPPFTLETPAVTAWTGDRLLIWGSHIRDQGERRGLLYDPRARSWTAVTPAPLALNLASAVWTGSEVVVVGSELNNRNVSSTRWAQGMAYDPARDTWRVLPKHPLSPQASWASWTGRQVLVWDYETNSALYDPASDSWREPNAMPIEFSECYPYSVATVEIVFASFCSQAAVFDIGRDRWIELAGGPFGEPTAPSDGALPVAAGEVVVVVSEPSQERGTARRLELWAYRPT